MYGYKVHKQYDVRLFFVSPCLPTVPHSAGLCPAVPQQASISPYVLWLTNCFIMYCGLHYTYSFVMYINRVTVYHGVHVHKLLREVLLLTWPLSTAF